MKQLIILALLLLTLGAFAQESDPFELVQKRLSKYFKVHPSENIYLQTDRDLYRAGDMVWFSAFVANPSIPGIGSASDNLVVSLFDSSGEKLNEDKYKMAGGLSKGNFELGDDIRPGTYVIVAYSGSTQLRNEVFMRRIFVDEFNAAGVAVNEISAEKLLVPGKPAVFEFDLQEMSGKPFDGKVSWELNYDGKSVVDGKEKTSENGRLKVAATLPAQAFEHPIQLVLKDGLSEIWSSWISVETEKIAVSFDVEGGQLLAGANQKLIFRPLNIWGWPVNAEVELREKKSGALVTKSKTLAPGFGVLSIAAKPGENYQLLVSSGAGKGQQFDLPEAAESGLALMVSRLDEQFIYCGFQSIGQASGEVNLIAYRGEQLIWATKVNLEASLNLKIPKGDFPQGLCQLVAFDSDRKLLAERLIYVDKNEQLDIEGGVSPELVARETPSNLKLQLSNDALVSFSVAPAEMVASAEPNFENVLELDGWLDSPLGNEVKSGESAINYQLAGNRFKNLDWAAVMAAQRAVPEAEGIVRARLEGQLPELVNAYALAHCMEPKPALSPGFCRANSFLFQKIRPKHTAPEKDNSYLTYLHSGSSLLDAIKMIKPYTMQGDLIIFPGGANSFLAQDGALIVIDGQKMGTSSSVLSSISPYDVESINVSTQPIDIQQYTGLNSVGLIDIKTKRGEKVVVTDTTPTKQYAEGNRVPGDFGESMLGNEGKQSGTLFWEPAFVVSPVAERQIPAPKIAGSYLVRVWSVDDAGKLGSKAIQFEVK